MMEKNNGLVQEYVNKYLELEPGRSIEIIGHNGIREKEQLANTIREVLKEKYNIDAMLVKEVERGIEDDNVIDRVYIKRKGIMDILQEIKEEVVIMNDEAEEKYEEWEMISDEEHYYQGEKDAFKSVIDLLNKYIIL